MMEKLSEDNIEQRLLHFPDWDFFDNALHAEFEFDNFKDCFSAMSRIAFECEAQNHHPNWSNVYNVLKISVSTHEVDGVTKKDFKLVEAIDAIVVPEDEE
jgi:4a-hydroxytetrahydrobiopterin dehydratase